MVHLSASISRSDPRFNYLTSMIPAPCSDSAGPALDGTQDTHWSEQGVLFPILSKLLQLGPPIDRCVFQGLCIAIGGLSESLSKHACQSLAASANADPALEEPCQGSWFATTCGHVQSIFQNNHRLDRVICPLMRAVDYLATSGHLDAHASEGDLDRFASHVIDSVRAEIQNCKDLQKLMLAVSLLCTFTSKGWAVRKALQALIVQLASRFPKVEFCELSRASPTGQFTRSASLFPPLSLPPGQVRIHTAENMYMALLTVLDEDMDTEGACQVLEEIRWDDDLAQVAKPARNRIVQCLGLRMPATVAKGLATAPAAKDVKITADVPLIAA